MSIPKASGIYKITNIVNGKCYVGSAVNLHKRKMEHFIALRGTKHCNKKIQNSFNKHGEVNFVFSVIELCGKGDLIVREQFWIDEIKPIYNICKIAGSTLGLVHTEETKAKIAATKVGYLNPSFGKTGIDSHNFGKTHSDAAKVKMAVAKTGSRNILYGKKHKPETLVKMSIVKTGKGRSAETRAKISATLTGKMVGEKNANFGRKATVEHRAKLSAAHVGKTASTETRAKMSESAKLRHQKTRFEKQAIELAGLMAEFAGPYSTGAMLCL